MPATKPIRGPEAFAATFNVSGEAIERLKVYEGLLRQWQKAVNLVAPSTIAAIWHRHFADSAQLLPLAPPATRSWIDLGSGAGFPGLVIAILLADKAQAVLASPLRAGPGGNSPLAVPRVTLVESDIRKAAFLREVVRQTAIPAGVPVDILPVRAESARIKINASLPRVVCARALAPLDRLLELAEPSAPPGTVLLLCKGKSVTEEVQTAEKKWKFKVELVPSITDSDGRIAVITDLERKAKD